MTLPRRRREIFCKREIILKNLGCSITKFYNYSDSFRKRYDTAAYTQKSLCDNKIFFSKLNPSSWECKHIDISNIHKKLLQHIQSFRNFHSALDEIKSKVNKTFQNEIRLILSGISNIANHADNLMRMKSENTKFINKYIEDTRELFNMAGDARNEKVHSQVFAQFVIRLDCFKKSVFGHCKQEYRYCKQQ